MERRNSSDDRTPRQSLNPNVFDDEYAVDPSEADFMPGMSDGFRPMNAGGDRDRQDHDRDQSPRRSFSASKPAEADMRRMASRNSTAKTPCARESISHDGRNPGTHIRGASSQATALQHRASISSTGSFATMARSESPYSGGPSHPYGMYPQNTTMARSSSVTTSSTQRQPHRSVSLQRPAHPYGMYPQNVMETPNEVPMPPAPPAIPVGFPGLNTGYHRQIGPDGEEQDIIGPDGHTEQLPPYSRYPEEGPAKAAMAAEASLTPVEVPVAPPNAPPNSSDDAPISPVSPTSPTSTASINQQPQRQEDQGRSPPSSGAASTTEQGISEKPELKNGWKKWSSRKLWGKVPLGVVLVLLILVLVFAIILGAAIGSFVAKGNKDKPDGHKKGGPNDDAAPQKSPPTGSMFDASPIPTPSALPSLPAGAFALPLGMAQESSPSCLTMANQLSAWSCKMTFVPLLLTVNNSLPNGSPQPMASIQPFTKPDGGIQYGVQPPTLLMQPLQLVIDQDYRAYGPAFHFQGVYDKVVVLTPDEFQAGASLRKWNGDDSNGFANNGNNNGGGGNGNGNGNILNGDGGQPGFGHRFQVQPGDTPWYCVWNQTFIEGYIYVIDNSTGASFTGFPSAFPTPFGSSIPVEPTGPPPSVTDAPHSRVFNGEPPPPTPTPTSFQRRGDGDYPRPPPYPRIVKIEERRLPGAPQPYCQKMLLLDNGVIVPAQDNQGNAVKVQLQENNPSLEEFLLSANSPRPNPSSSSLPASANTSSAGARRDLEKRRDPAGACHCQWMFQ
ncbi:hypothetical protein K469DRAFT_325320 [Zopfia rhizophila CBS 207.26]|uniref:DUF7820 domain-containing protein n=1 Tax=Zopfia rhizophila CBS 207.26 TaxID=1314779 RepID=A0A6A6DKU2_9PEZI|nr:hypothetical protein K469DRAFT_325320 [Zopfia rhizophila CBS 207.26]